MLLHAMFADVIACSNISVSWTAAAEEDSPMSAFKSTRKGSEFFSVF
jgi:hypothetical protein